jgi:hypothetical protein
MSGNQISLPKSPGRHEHHTERRHRIVNVLGCKDSPNHQMSSVRNVKTDIQTHIHRRKKLDLERPKRETERQTDRRIDRLHCHEQSGMPSR